MHRTAVANIRSQAHEEAEAYPTFLAADPFSL